MIRSEVWKREASTLRQPRGARPKLPGRRPAPRSAAGPRARATAGRLWAVVALAAGLRVVGFMGWR
jgi:hypothetical protein